MELSDVARAFIQRASVGRLATVDAGGAPHVIPICFVLLDGRVYSVIDEKPKRTTRLQRLRNLEANPRVALVIDRYSDDWSQLAWVMMRGLAEIIEAGRGARRGDRRAAREVPPVPLHGARRPASDPSAAGPNQRLGPRRLIWRHMMSARRPRTCGCGVSPAVSRGRGGSAPTNLLGG